MIRWATIGFLLLALVGASAYDRVEIAPEIASEDGAIALMTPQLDSSPPESEVWYCPVGSSIPDGYADQTVYVTNIGESLMTAEIRTMTADGFGPSLRVEVESNTTEPVQLSSISSEVVAGAMVDIIGGHALVGHQVVTDFGSPVGPCHSAVAEEWFFASGATSRDAKDLLVLLNPFENSVIFTATFQTTTRSRVPGELERAVVPPNSVRVIDVGEYVSREPIVAVTVETVQGGRLAVERLQTFDGQLGPVGSSLDLGTPLTATEWIFPAGRIIPGANNSITIYNPGEVAAEVDLQLDPLDPSDRATFGLIPIELTVPPGRPLSVDIAEILAPYGLPESYELGITALSTNDVPVVASRWQLTPAIDTTLIGAGGDNANSGEGDQPVEEVIEVGPGPEIDPADVLRPPFQPDPVIGSTTSIGQPKASTRWAIPWIDLRDNEETVLAISAPEGALVEARLVVGGEVLPPVRTSVGANGRAILALPPVATGAAVLIDSDMPVTVAGLVVVSDSDYQHIAAVAFSEGP